MMTRSLRTAETFRCRIIHNESGLDFLKKRIERHTDQHKKVFVLADVNTREHCLPLLFNIGIGVEPDHVICIPPGEEHKSVHTAEYVWEQMTALGCARNSLLINLGGGVITDLGGFVASTFHRGISFIHVPTTLLGMVDAAIGGKNAVNLGNLKNQVGLFQLPEAVVIHPEFLKTLPEVHVLSGIAEAAKTALIGDARFWRYLSSMPVRAILDTSFENPLWTRLIRTSTGIKNEIVHKDFRERKRRKALNFGHTVGHALESCFMESGQPISHGNAVAWGMIAEAHLSHESVGLPEKDLETITEWIIEGFGRPSLNQEQVEKVFLLMKYDKKRMEGGIRFSLIRMPGEPVVNCDNAKLAVARSIAYLTQTSYTI